MCNTALNIEVIYMITSNSFIITRFRTYHKEIYGNIVEKATKERLRFEEYYSYLCKKQVQ